MTALIALLWLSGCGATYQATTEADFERVSRSIESLPENSDEREEPEFDGSVEAYVRAALAQNPGLRASFERWRAAIHRIPQAKRLPEPTLTYSYFVQSVETRVGPQRHRVGLKMAFPWPTRLTAGADAASIAARAQQRRFEARALGISRHVVQVYWQIWQLRQTRQILRDQLEILRALSDVTRVRIEVNAANLADVNQVDLAFSRLEDRTSGLDERDRFLTAELRAAIGFPPGKVMPVEPIAFPQGGVPQSYQADLTEAAKTHPRVEAFELMSESSMSEARRARADQAPSFLLGVDWIETGEALDQSTPGSGTDPVILTVGLSLPLWVYSYNGAVEEARSESQAFRAEAIEAHNRALADLDQILSVIRDADRRIRLYEGTLIPQAETAYISVIGAYQAGESTIAATLLAQRELLELKIGLIRARTDHEIAWARLEDIVGHEVPRTDADER